MNKIVLSDSKCVEVCTTHSIGWYKLNLSYWILMLNAHGFSCSLFCDHLYDDYLQQQEENMLKIHEYTLSRAARIKNLQGYLHRDAKTRRGGSKDLRE